MSAQTAQPLKTASPPRGERPGEQIVLPGQTPKGEYVLGVLLKRTYQIVPGKRCVRAEKDQKLVAGDEPYGDPATTSIKCESDFVPYKLATDVVLNGTAHAPGGKPTAAWTAALAVGQHRKELRVCGDRVCRHRDRGEPVFTDPQPFKTLELRYEYAYGGVDVYSDPKMPCVYARNHLGRGFVIKNSKKTVEGLALPNIEDPNDLLTPARLCTGHFMHWEKQPQPQGFGWYSKYWQPRASLA